jgi:ribosomal protein L37AE/L43A
MAKGYRCPTCGKQSGQYRNGSYQCNDKKCSALWWGPFNKPSAGEKRKGFACFQCGRKTVHPVAKLGSVDVYRCSTCGASLLEPT